MSLKLVVLKLSISFKFLTPSYRGCGTHLSESPDAEPLPLMQRRVPNKSGCGGDNERTRVPLMSSSTTLSLSTCVRTVSVREQPAVAWVGTAGRFRRLQLEVLWGSAASTDKASSSPPSRTGVEGIPGEAEGSQEQEGTRPGLRWGSKRGMMLGPYDGPLGSLCRGQGFLLVAVDGPLRHTRLFSHA